MDLQEVEASTTCLFCRESNDGTIAPESPFSQEGSQVADEFQVGHMLEDRYLLLRTLGRGGMGQVFVARDLRLERTVAIKVVLHHREHSPELEVTLAREARLGASLNHRGIASVYDFGLHGRRSYTVFEFIEGETLRQILTRRGSLPLEEVLIVVRDLALALDFAHAHGVIHRDLKPENVCCSKSGDFKLLDLGLAREIHTDPEHPRYSGTPAYSSPEQCACLPADGKSDQYSLALLAFEMLSGQRAFSAQHPWDVLQAQINLPPPSICNLVDALPEHVEQALQCALSKRPEDRFATCFEFAAALAGPFAPSALKHVLATQAEQRLSFYLAYASEQYPVARQIAEELLHLRYTSWLFSLHAVAGVASGKQVQSAMERSQAAILMISKAALRSNDFGHEVEYAFRLHLPLIPILVDLSREEFTNAAPAWMSLLSSVPLMSISQDANWAEVVEQIVQQADTMEVQCDEGSLDHSKRGDICCNSHAWATDANQIDIVSLRQVLFRNGAVEDFLNSRHRHFIAAPKGFGKTLLLTCKRQAVTQGIDAGGAIQFVPEGRPYLDFMSELRSLSARYEEPLSQLNNTKRWWSAALRISAISHHPDVITEEERCEFSAFPPRIARWLGGNKVQPTVVFKELTSLSVSELNRLIDESENFLDQQMRQIHGPTFFFIDKVDQAIRHLNRDAWISIQAGLIEAAWETMNANSHLKIYASIRQEAFSNYQSDIKSNLFSATTNLEYTEGELQSLVDQLARCYEGCQSFADFIGMRVIRHARRPTPEETFHYVRRHTSGRPRDLVAIASAISPRRASLGEKELRSLVQQTSAKVLVSNVFDEVTVFLNCLHDRDARLRFLSRIPANILSKQEAIAACEQFNGLPEGTLDHFGEDSSAIFHPFRDLYFTGLLGTLHFDAEDGRSIQRFRRANDPLSCASVDLPDSAVYLIHPALDTFIRAHATRSSFLQYQHIPVGENLPWEDHFASLLPLEKHLQAVNDAQFRDLAHQLVKRIQSRLGGERVSYARSEIEHSSQWQTVRAYAGRTPYDDALFWLVELLGCL